jgi:glutathione S-transferase
MLIELTQHQVQYGHEATMGLNKRILKAFLDLRFATSSPERARHAEEKVLAALDRLDAELDGREYLAGDRFSVADLTAAALLYPFTMPPQAPWRPTKLPQAWVDFSEANRERPCHDWALAMYERHRAPAPAAAPAAAPA